MGLSAYLTQLAFVAIFLIITNLCPVMTQSDSTPTNKTTSSTADTTSSNGTTNLYTSTGTSAESTTDASISPALPMTNTTPRPTPWIPGYVVFCSVGVMALLVLLVVVSVVSITMDRRYSGREQGTVTLNRMDRIGTQLQRMSPGLRLELQSVGSVEDDSVLMMPEQAMTEPVQPVSADQTNHLLMEDTPTVSHCVENKAAIGHYEECKFARASAESLDLLMDMSDLDEANVATHSTHDANALRYRSYSADPSRRTNQQMPTIRLYSNPERDRKFRDNLPDAPADTLSDISTTGMDDLRVTDCSATPFDREESVDMYGADSPSPADCKNESFVHSPSASVVVAYHKKMEKPANDPPRNTLPSGPHVYEELKDMRSVNEATTSKESCAASSQELCKITFPQYFQLNDRVVQDARAAAGYTKPRTAQTLPRQDVPYSLALLSTSQEELADGGNNMSSVRARRGTGILAAINQQHRLSDGALDGAQQHREVNPYNSIQRQNVPSMTPYSKLKRGPSVSSPKAPSMNVYDKLKLADDSEVTGQASQLNETTRL